MAGRPPGDRPQLRGRSPGVRTAASRARSCARPRVSGRAAVDGADRRLASPSAPGGVRARALRSPGSCRVDHPQWGRIASRCSWNRPSCGLAAIGRHREAFIDRLQDLRAGAQRDRHLRPTSDEAHLDQELDLGHGRCPAGEWLAGGPTCPGALGQGVVLMGSIYNEGEVRRGPCPRRRRAPSRRCAGCGLRCPTARSFCCGWSALPSRPGGPGGGLRSDIALVPLPSYSPDLMPCGRCSGAGCARTSPITTATAALNMIYVLSFFEIRINTDPCACSSPRVEGRVKLIQAPPRRTNSTSSR